MIRSCEMQVRVGMSGVYALDYTAVLGFASLAGVRPGPAALLLSELLPTVERMVVRAYRKDDDT